MANTIPNRLKILLEDHNISMTQLLNKINEHKMQNLTYPTLHSIVSNKSSGSRNTQNKIMLALKELLKPENISREDVFPNSLTDGSSVNLNTVFKRVGLPEITFVRPREYNELKSVINSVACVSIEGPSGIGKTSCLRKLMMDTGVFQKYKWYSARDKKHLEEINQIADGELTQFCVIDDVHRLDEDILEKLTDRLKYIAEQETEKERIIILGINKIERSLFASSPDLVGRVKTIKFRPVPKEKLEELINLGEKALNIEFEEKQAILEACQGSFQLLQFLCNIICTEAEIFEKQPDKKMVKVEIVKAKSALFEELANAFLDKTRQIVTEEGLATKPGRAPYLSLLRMLAGMNDNSLSLSDVRHQNESLYNIINGYVTSGSLQKLLNQAAFGSLIYFDSIASTIYAEDPKFFYYLKNLDWEDFARKCGYDSIDFYWKYDFALSFANSEIRLAEAIAKMLNEAGIPAFYYVDEQSNMLGGKIGDYLIPVYESESDLVISIISQDYARNFWTRFEANIIKERIAEKRVIPILVDGTHIDIFSDKRDLTAIPFSTKKDFDQQVQAAVNLLKAITLKRRNRNTAS